MNPKDFLENFDPVTTNRKLVQRHYEEYLMRGGNDLIFRYRGRHWTNDKLRIKVIKGDFCEVCGIHCGPLTHIHHVIPRSSGGSDEIRNLAVLCPNCHCAIHHVHDTGDYVGIKAMYADHAYKKLKKFINCGKVIG